MRALITGGRGFVGHWLARAPRRARATRWWRSTRRSTSPTSAPSAAVVAEAAPDAVYHLAALTHVGESWDDPAEVLRVNVLGTAAVLAAARALARPPAGAGGELGRGLRRRSGPEELPLTEDMPGRPRSTPYAASKAAAEQVALQAWRGFGQPVVVVRPFNHVGPGQAADLRRLGAWPAGSSTPGARGRRAGGGDLAGPAGLHRRPRRGARLPAAGRGGASRAPSTTSARGTTWPSPRSPSGCWPWPAPSSSW